MKEEFGLFNTSIVIVGGVSDIKTIIDAVKLFFSDNIRQSKDLGISLRTSSTNERLTHAVHQSLLRFTGDEHLEIIKSLFSGRYDLIDTNYYLLWQYSLNNMIVRKITADVFVKQYLAGRVGVSKEEIIGYFIDLSKSVGNGMDQWSDSTKDRIASKYLNFMKKLGFLEGDKKKVFRPLRYSSESLVIFLYLIKLLNEDVRNILINEMLPLSFLEQNELIERLKKLSLKGLFDMSYTGKELNIDFKYEYKGICDVLCNRT